MRFALCLYRYFPYGGMQRNFLRIAEECCARGHAVDVYTMRWEGDRPGSGINVHLLASRGWRNHTKHERFAGEIGRILQPRQHDFVLGFNKMPGLDAYYAADPCFLDRAHTARSAFYRFTPRYRHFQKFERAVFDPRATVRIMLLSPRQQEAFQRWYATPDDRFALLPPYVAPDRVAVATSSESRSLHRSESRRELGMHEDDIMLLMIGSDFHRKGVDRAIRALASLPDKRRRASHLVVLGRGKAGRYRWLASRLGVKNHVHLRQARDDVGAHLAAADLLLHIAREENTGTAIVEAIAAGLPVLATANCGYAFHVARAEAGCVLDEPFDQDALNEQLAAMIGSERDQIARWRESALDYAGRTDLFSRPQHAVSLLERWADERRGGLQERRGGAGREETGAAKASVGAEDIAPAREAGHG